MNSAAEQVETQSFQTTELDLPESTAGILLLFGGLIALTALTVRTSLRDSRFLQRLPRTVLLIPRLIVVALILVIVLNPQRRTQLSRVEQSRVGILLDTSLSMAWPAADPVPNGASSQQISTTETRAEAAVQSLIASGVVAEISRTHVVMVYTFDSELSGPWAVVTENTVRFVDAKTAAGGPVPTATLSLDEPRSTVPGAVSDPAALKQWKIILQPRGSETRLGEALYQLVGQLSGRTLSGLVVVSDGRSNAGLDTEPARTRAERTGTRLITVGIGSQKPQMNLWVAGMQSPTDVHQGDPFDVTVMIQGSGSADQQATVRLFQQTADGDGKDRRQISEQTVKLNDDAIPASIRFTQQLAVPGKYDFIARIESPAGATEMTVEDNERRRSLEVTDRRMKVLLISSGPIIKH